MELSLTVDRYEVETDFQWKLSSKLRIYGYADTGISRYRYSCGGLRQELNQRRSIVSYDSSDGIMDNLIKNDIWTI